ncbi:hypothetical protein QSM_2085 [Clostridioides difficile P30]|nr:hypothetical protein QSM_2085 [Clostridioides difficile P30]
MEMLSLFWGFISTMWYVKNLDILSHILVATCFISTMWYVKWSMSVAGK